MSEFHTRKHAPRAVAFSTMQQNGLHIFMALPAIFIVPLDWTLNVFGMDFRPWRLYLMCNSFVNLFNGIAFAILPESPKFLLTINQKEKALSVLKRVYAFNTGKPQEVKIRRNHQFLMRKF